MKKALIALMAMLLALTVVPAAAMQLTGFKLPVENCDLSLDRAFTYDSERHDYYLNDNSGRFTYDLDSDTLTATEGTVTVIGRAQHVKVGAADVALGEKTGETVTEGRVCLTAADGAVELLSGPVTPVGSVSLKVGGLTVVTDAPVKLDNKTAHLYGGAEISGTSTGVNVQVDADAAVTLNGAVISASAGPALRIAAPHRVTLTLAAGAANTMTGGGGNYAGVEVEWNSGSEYADLTIVGSGSLTANGNGSGAGIGGSKIHNGVYGNITINSGTIVAKGVGRSAGIGSSDNPNDGASHGSYKYTTEGWGTITINGGDIKAYGEGNGAGIGGGNHTDSGLIIINNGTIYAEGDSGIGAGLGSSGGATKGPGYYCGYVTINGGDVTAYATDNMGAGIGGGMYSDGVVTITGGTVRASVSTSGNAYQGGAGIGGGYQGLGQVTITGGNVTATGGNSGAGIGNGALGATTTTKNHNGTTWTGTKSVRGGLPNLSGSEAVVTITGGTVNAYGGVGAAGIGSGNACEWSNVSISGGTVNAYGGKSTEGAKEGGAGIGSGISYSTNKMGYMKETEVHVSITGGTVYAEGGWGAAGVGSGAKNKTAASITIGQGVTLHAYSDGTKFALDTRDGNPTRVSAGVLQGTFMFPWNANSGSQNARGLKHVTVTNETGSGSATASLPDGYRSFAVNVGGSGQYSVYATDGGVAGGRGAYFSASRTEGSDDLSGSEDPENKNGNTVLLPLTSGSLSDNHFLYPVKTIRVDKKVESDGTIGTEAISMTAYFRLKYKGEDRYLETPGMQSIRIEGGVAQAPAFFVNVPEGEYSIIETDDQGQRLALNTVFDTAELASIETRDHSEGGADNTGTISASHWSDDVTVINRFARYIATIDIPVTKSWVDSDNQDGLRPDSVTINLLANGEVVRSATVAGTGNTWSYTFTGVDRAQNGQEIAYTITENPVPGYTAEVSGFSVVNTHAPELITVSGVKTWDDQNNVDGLRPASVTVNLLADGVRIQSQTVAGTGNAWEYAFTGLPRYADQGRAIVYTVTEDAVPGYTMAVSGYSLINTHVPELITVNGVKTWDDQNDVDGLRPASVTVNLLADGVRVQSQTVTGTGSAWEYAFTGLPRYGDQGRAIVYTVTEDAVPGYTTAYAGLNITNTHTPERVTVSGVKTWDDRGNADGLRPASVTVYLLADGVRTQSQTVTGSGDTWAYSFADLPRYVNGREIVYTIAEAAVEGYTTAVNGYDLVNTHVPAAITVSGTKIWVDHGDQDGLRPAGVTIRLLANGVERDSRALSGSGDSWAFSFTDLPEYENGAKVVYTVAEDAVAGYETTIAGYDVYNVHSPKGADPTQYTLTVRYWADGQRAFPDFKATHQYGDRYNVVSPTLAGYTVDQAAVSGVIYQDTVLDVYYTPKTVKLTVYYQYLNGTAAADTHYETLRAGDIYGVASPEIENYVANIQLVSGTMPGYDVEYVVIYVTRPGFVPAYDPDDPTGARRGSGLVVIDDFGTPLGLGGVELNAGDCFD